jgi:hypothetical protein
LLANRKCQMGQEKVTLSCHVTLRAAVTGEKCKVREYKTFDLDTILDPMNFCTLVFALRVLRCLYY